MSATPLNLSRQVFRALAAYDRRGLSPWPHEYRITTGDGGMEEQDQLGEEGSGSSEMQGIDMTVIELRDHNGDVLAEFWIHPAGRETFVNKAGKVRWFSKKAKP